MKKKLTARVSVLKETTFELSPEYNFLVDSPYIFDLVKHCF